ncbi:SCO2525 family SAM-dependent methyltransferase [Actinoplanes sp. TRM 88003]|uniref:SCO2525 family SAM-dependent methyltransferase n=1 Tax=Paractinoplanes aksuensis TaxID=2939490 RepID=A0ABT1DKF6_9ACTN|nr:SCO2525 family SAM-dependent methyltransferase [Actinoplanes aksuensis]MCO8271323.1 SCO2525 family SAM-dependent methyltransferase [Actinoplanes aksuensis]
MNETYPRSTSPPTGIAERPVENGQVNWDAFNSNAYFSHNYGELRSDDRRIIEIVADFFKDNPPAPELGRAIDVGPGANLYPAMVMLPYAARVTLFERSHANLTWLADELQKPHGSWWQFWEAISTGRPAYDPINKPLDTLHGRVSRERGNVFALRADQYDIGTMFFVAESITTRTDEFRRATRLFVTALRRNAPFAAAFMRLSSGYVVGDEHFPACSIDEEDVDQALAPVARNVKIERVESEDLRVGYDGMIVATGRRK